MWVLFLVTLCFAATGGLARADELRVLAAGSLREVIGTIGERYKTATDIGVTADLPPGSH